MPPFSDYRGEYLIKMQFWNQTQYYWRKTSQVPPPSFQGDNTHSWWNINTRKIVLHAEKWTKLRYQYILLLYFHLSIKNFLTLLQHYSYSWIQQLDPENYFFLNSFGASIKKKYQIIITMFADLNKDLKNCKYTNFYPLVRQNLRGGPSSLPLFLPGTLSVNHDNLLICYMELVLCSEKNFHQSFLTFLQIEKTFTFKSPFCGNYYSEAAASTSWGRKVP